MSSDVWLNSCSPFVATNTLRFSGECHVMFGGSFNFSTITRVVSLLVKPSISTTVNVMFIPLGSL